MNIKIPRRCLGCAPAVDESDPKNRKLHEIHRANIYILNKINDLSLFNALSLHNGYYAPSYTSTPPTSSWLCHTYNTYCCRFYLACLGDVVVAVWGIQGKSTLVHKLSTYYQHIIHKLSTLLSFMRRDLSNSTTTISNTVMVTVLLNIDMLYCSCVV